MMAIITEQQEDILELQREIEARDKKGLRFTVVAGAAVVLVFRIAQILF